MQYVSSLKQLWEASCLSIMQPILLQMFEFDKLLRNGTEWIVVDDIISTAPFKVEIKRHKNSGFDMQVVRKTNEWNT